MSNRRCNCGGRFGYLYTLQHSTSQDELFFCLGSSAIEAFKMSCLPFLFDLLMNALVTILTRIHDFLSFLLYVFTFLGVNL